MEFSLFYFADGQGTGREQYRLLLDGARFADTHGFSAVWTPERHFHEFGGLYPNPAVTAAALAATTERVAIRAGSVVGPLHHPVRIAEEWSVVDNLSNGRVGLSFAPGWHAEDFVLRPENYVRRREILLETIETVRRLWRQESVELPDSDGKPVAVRSYPAPVQPELPLWLTSAGSPQTFQQAGELGLGLLTHLLGQDLDELAKKIEVYRCARPQGARGAAGHVALMLHTFLGADREVVRETVRRPFTEYIRSSISLIMKAAGDIMPGVDPDELDPEDLEFLVERSFDRYFDTGGLFGTVEDGLRTLERLTVLGVDEVACLIDFGVDTDQVLAALDHLALLKDAWSAREAGS
ncbi:MupA/Atu3671 family FMN-dependent luciferase-like monooxygenase [Kitasatospora kifunensis]|uniref:Natural product biosynthesis luciferase-like monooxygenase protein n=1 Tax=Kitasatospora kifunensis TaxID=58351 RepID=A0A7W7QWP3_KITKI|nr:MupA/Atu3671 family FMN-dependent luciferase-like monooxygenase [Kitasatospora kifunensis]MBB4921190.1 natural product biosynthesis luciferase-like monooxygenase protein [Kitasatospora kifunensis]